MKIQVCYCVELDEKEANKMLAKVKEFGLDYGDDPGPKEILRRVLVTEGTAFLEEDNGGVPYKIVMGQATTQ